MNTFRRTSDTPLLTRIVSIVLNESFKNARACFETSTMLRLWPTEGSLFGMNEGSDSLKQILRFVVANGFQERFPSAFTRTSLWKKLKQEVLNQMPKGSFQIAGHCPCAAAPFIFLYYWLMI